MKRDHRYRTGKHSARPSKKGSTITEPFVMHRQSLIESDAMGALTLAARRVLDRLQMEHLAHAGKENGRLVVTFEQFEKFGVRRASVAAAIDLLVNVGLVEITEQGRGGNREFRRPNRYRLTFLDSTDGAATDEWASYTALTPDRDIDSRRENASGTVGAITRPKTPSVRRDNASETRRDNEPEILFLSRGGHG